VPRIQNRSQPVAHREIDDDHEPPNFASAASQYFVD